MLHELSWSLTHVSLLCRIALITQEETSCFSVSVVVWVKDPLKNPAGKVWSPQFHHLK